MARNLSRALIGALLLAMAVCLANAAGDDAAAVVKAKLAAMKAAGVSVDYQELVPKPIPDQDNGAKLYMRAADILKQRDDAVRQAAPPNARPVERYDTADLQDPTRMAVVAKYVQEDVDALGLVKEAASKPYAWFNLDWSDPPRTLFPHLAKMRNLARFVSVAAILASMQGKQGEALDDLRAGFAMGRQLSPEPTLIDQLVCYAIDGVLERTAEKVVGFGPLPEKEALALNDELGRAGYQAGLDRALQMERCFGIWFFDELRKDPAKAAEELGVAGAGQGGTDWQAYGKRQAAATYADESVYLEQMDRKAALAALPWREAAAKANTEGPQAVPAWAKLTRMMVSAIPPISKRRDQAMALRALVGATLGIELCKQKAGSYPATLAEVKQGGWKLADDPFSGGPLKYKKIGGTYLLYSLGPDLKDDGGTPMAYQLGEFGKPSDNGDIVWMGTWPEAARGEN